MPMAVKEILACTFWWSWATCPLQGLIHLHHHWRFFSTK